ncbi:MAG: CBS domain-containing protein [Crenarchaeota archaeon]|nr:CBS domain-containing protein [Thermoproteota archaeon]
MAGLLVRDIMLKDFPVVDKDETLEHAVRVMRRYDTDRVVVVEKGKLVGIMTKKDIMMKLATLRTRRLVPGRLHVSSFMSIDPVTIRDTEEAVKAAEVMLGKGIGSLPVLNEAGELVGLVTRWEAAALIRDREDLKAIEAAATLPFALKMTDKVLHARKLLTQYNLLFLPVIDDEGKPIGYVTVDEVADALFAFHEIVPEKYRKERIEHLLVADIMRPRPPVAAPDDPLPEVYERMRRKNSKGAIVVQGDKIMGVITLIELLKMVTLHAK